MRAGAEQAGSSPDNGATHLSKLPYRGARNPVCAGDELDLTGVQLPLDRSRHLAQTLKHRSGAVDLAPGHRVNQEKLLFDAYRKRLSRAKPAFTVPLCGHGREVCPALSDSAGAGSAAISAPPAAQTTTVRAGWHAWSPQTMVDAPILLSPAHPAPRRSYARHHGRESEHTSTRAACPASRPAQAQR